MKTGRLSAEDMLSWEKSNMEKRFMTRKYTVVPEWASKNLKLSGNELMLFSYIYGFSQDEGSCCYSTSKEISDLLCISQRSVFNILESLINKKLIVRVELNISGLKAVGYRANNQRIDEIENEYLRNFIRDEKISFLGSATGYEEISYNDNIKNNINNNINSEINLNSSNSKKIDNKEKENIYETIVSPIFSKDSKKKRFEKPTFEEVEAYIREQGYDIDPHTFFDYYEACGWTVGKNKPMKDWKASVRYWVSSRKNNGYASKPAEEEHQLNVRQYFPGDEDKIPF